MGDPRHRATTSGMRRRPARVLVVDDDRLVAEGLRHTLEEDCQVVVENDGAPALARLLSGERFDVVLSDVRMPGMDGIELYERLAAVMPQVAARIVFMSGGAFGERGEAFFARVPNLLLDKPVDPEGLRALVQRRVIGDAVTAGRSG